MFEHSLLALFLLVFAVIIFIPALIIGSVGTHRLIVIRQEQRTYTNTTCFVLNVTQEALPFDCNCDGCHPETCYAEHFTVQYQIENGTTILSMINIDQIPQLLQIQVNNNYRCFYNRADPSDVQWLQPTERPALAMLIVGFSVAVGTYIVEYDYIAKSSDELTIRKGDIITDAISAEDGWLKGECRGTFGHFPENFVTPLTKEKAKNRTFANELGSRLQSAVNGNKSGTLRKRPTNDDNLFQSQQSNNLPNGTLFQVKVAYAYIPVHDDELSINPNDIVNVTRLVEEGWYEGVLDGKLGLFPSNYVTRINEETSSKKDPPVKRKPVNGLSALINKEINKSVSPTSMDTPSSQQKTPATPPLLTTTKKNTPIKARVLYDYKKAADDELTLAINDIVTILDKNLEDEGWWKGELHGRIGVFPDNYVEEIPASSTLSTNSKHRPNTPEAGTKNLSQTLPKPKITNGDSSHGYSNDSHHAKPTSISDEEGHASRNHYAEINNLDAIGTTEKLSGFNKPRPVSAKRPPSSITRKNENGLSKTTGSLDETNHNNRPQFTDVKNERKLHTPSPPSSQREPGQLESPRYTNRPSSLHSTLSNPNYQTNSTLNGTTEIVQTATNSSYVNSSILNNNSTTIIEQLQKDLLKMKISMDDMKVNLADQIRDLVGELDEEKKARATLQIELERLQKQIQKSSLVN